MDSGLARFAVLVVLFFLLTGDLAGIVRHMFEESDYVAADQRQDKAAASTARPAEGRSPVVHKGSADDEDDPDVRAFGKKIATGSSRSLFETLVGAPSGTRGGSGNGKRAGRVGTTERVRSGSEAVRADGERPRSINCPPRRSSVDRPRVLPVSDGGTRRERERTDVFEHRYHHSIDIA